MTKTVVILGASLGGLPIAHYLLKHTAPKADIKVVLVAPTTDLYWSFAVVRGILPGQLPDDKLFFPVGPGLKKYPSSKFEFVLGRAEALDPAASSVTVRTNDGAERTIAYDTVVVATGSSFREGVPFKSLATTEETKTALHAWQERIKAAKNIVVAGAGATGVETAAELGEQYARTGLKTVTLVHNHSLPFDDAYTDSVRQTAKKELKALGVKFVGDAVLGTRDGPGETVDVTFTKTGNKETIAGDLYIPAFGVVPNTSFLPAELLDAGGYVKADRRLRAGGHDNVFVVGDASNIETPQAVHTDAQVVYLARALHARLAGAGGAPADYVPSPKVLFSASLGKSRGVGQVGTWRLWSFIVASFKSKTLGTENAPELAAGNRTLREKKW